MKSCVFFVLTAASLSALAQPTSLIKRADATPPYILIQYKCELFKATRREDGSTFGPVEDTPQNTSLAVTSEVYENLALKGVQNWLSYMKTNKDVATKRAKIKQFEDSGNIEAMKYWDQKLIFETQVKQKVIMNDMNQKYISNIVADNSIKTFHEPAGGNLKKYLSFDEMKLDSQNYCDVRSRLN